MRSNCNINFVFLSVPAHHMSISVLEVTLATFEINLQMVLLHVSPKVAVALHFLIAVKTVQQSLTVSLREFDHAGILGVGVQSHMLCPVISVIENCLAFLTHLRKIGCSWFLFDRVHQRLCNYFGQTCTIYHQGIKS